MMNNFLKRCVLGAMLLALLLFTGTGWAAEGLLSTLEDEIADILDVNRSGVVRIHALYPTEAGDAGAIFTHGTGFIFDSRGYILTVEGAVQGAEEIRVILTSGVQMKAEFVGSDSLSEVAVIRVPTQGLPTVAIGNSERIRIGHYGFILGNDFGNLVHSTGAVHEIDRDNDLIQMAARVQASYGGAPVFCSNGKVGGMVWRYPDLSRMFRKLGLDDRFVDSLVGLSGLPTSVYVIPINRAMRVANRLVRDGEMIYGWMGGEVVDMPQKGVVVTGLALPGPAWKGGLQVGDVVLSFMGRSVINAHHLRRLVMDSDPGTEVRLGILRESKVRAHTVKVDRMPDEWTYTLQPPTVAEQTSSLEQAVDQGWNGLWQMLIRQK